MYKLNLKKLAKIEKRYQNSSLVMGVLSESINGFYNSDINTIEKSRSMLFLMDYGLIKEMKSKKEKKEVKKTSKK